MSPAFSRTTERTTVPGSPALPQVNLLPPEIRAGRQLSSIKGWLGIGLLATVLLAGGLVVLSELGLRDAESELADTQDVNAALVAEQAQYAAVPTLLGRLDDLMQARFTGMASEVLWRPYFAALTATAPAGVSITSLSVVPPIADAVVAPTDITDIAIATVTFEAQSLTLPDTAAWLDALEPVHGLRNAQFSSALISQNAESGVVYYTVTGSVDVTYDGLAMRFVPTDDETDATEED